MTMMDERLLKLGDIQVAAPSASITLPTVDTAVQVTGSPRVSSNRKPLSLAEAAHP